MNQECRTAIKRLKRLKRIIAAASAWQFLLLTEKNDIVRSALRRAKNTAIAY